MDTLFQNKYRIESTRLKNWDYSSHGAYFITICTRNRKCVLGEIVNGKIQLSRIGETIQKYWLEIPEHFKNVGLDEFVIMPNHLHGIIVRNDNRNHFHACRDAINRVSTTETTNTTKTINGNKNPGGITQKYNPMLNTSLSTIIRWFKGRSKYEIIKIGSYNFQWQPRFYEHVIRNESELNRIREYIMNNPVQWKFDKNNPEKPKRKI